MYDYTMVIVMLYIISFSVYVINSDTGTKDLTTKNVFKLIGEVTIFQLGFIGLAFGMVTLIRYLAN